MLCESERMAAKSERRAQAPLKRRLSKSAKGRLKKRLRKEKGDVDNKADQSENGNRE